MNLYRLIKQANYADKLGKYRLADQYFNKAVKLASITDPIVKAFEEASAKGIDHAIIESILRDATLEGEALEIGRAHV